MKEKSFQFFRTTLFIIGLLLLIMIVFFNEILPFQNTIIIWIISGTLGLLLFIIEIIKFRRDAKKK
jgi:fatty acid desaturase